MDATINQNYAECIKTADHFGSTTYYNICTNTHVDVPWGAFGWFEVGLLSCFLLAVLVFVMCLIGKMLFDL